MSEKKSKKALADEAAVAEKIASWPGGYRAIGERLHEVILETAPELQPRLWYGAAGYAKDGPVLVFFRVDEFMSFGLTEKANVAAGAGAADQLIGSAWYLKDDAGGLTAATEERIAEIVRHAVG